MVGTDATLIHMMDGFGTVFRDLREKLFVVFQGWVLISIIPLSNFPYGFLMFYDRCDQWVVYRKLRIF